MRFFQGERDLCLDILPPHGKARAPASAVRPAKQALEEITNPAWTLPSAEDVAEAAVFSAYVPPAGRRREVLACLPVGSELVIPLALFRIGKHFVRFV